MTTDGLLRRTAQQISRETPVDSDTVRAMLLLGLSEEVVRLLINAALATNKNPYLIAAAYRTLNQGGDSLAPATPMDHHHSSRYAAL